MVTTQQLLGCLVTALLFGTLGGFISGYLAAKYLTRKTYTMRCSDCEATTELRGDVELMFWQALEFDRLHRRHKAREEVIQ